MTILRTVVAGGLTALALIAGGAPMANATSPHFVAASDSINSANQLVVSFKEAGLGANQNIDYLVSADASSTWACINGGGNHPKAANKETVSAAITQPATFNSGKNGNVTATITVMSTPIGPGSFSCPSGQRLVLWAVSYSNVMLADLTNGESVSLPSLSRSLV